MRPFALALMVCVFSGAALAQSPALIERFDKAAITRAATDLRFKVRDLPPMMAVITPPSETLPPGAKLEYRSLEGKELRPMPAPQELADALSITTAEGLIFTAVPGDCMPAGASMVCDSIVFSSKTRLPDGFNGATFTEVINNKMPIKLMVKGYQLDCQLRLLVRGGVTPANLRANMKEFAEAAATLKEDG
jgi:hypothetical protein